ncbi:hypothetical protein Tco_0881773 [Tanacetum coccineum]
MLSFPKCSSVYSKSAFSFGQIISATASLWIHTKVEGLSPKGRDLLRDEARSFLGLLLAITDVLLRILSRLALTSYPADEKGENFVLVVFRYTDDSTKKGLVCGFDAPKEGSGGYWASMRLESNLMQQIQRTQSDDGELLLLVQNVEDVKIDDTRLVVCYKKPLEIPMVEMGNEISMDISLLLGLPTTHKRHEAIWVVKAGELVLKVQYKAFHPQYRWSVSEDHSDVGRYVRACALEWTVPGMHYIVLGEKMSSTYLLEEVVKFDEGRKSSSARLTNEKWPVAKGEIEMRLYRDRRRLY